MGGQWQYRVFTGLLVVAALVVVIWLLCLGAKADAAVWAGWMQALGTAVAVWGSFSVSRQAVADQQAAQKVIEQGEEDKRRRENDSKLRVIHAICYDVLLALVEAERNVKNEFHKQYFQLRPARLEDAQYMLRGITLQSLPEGTVEGLLGLQQCVSRSLRDVERWYEQKKNYPFSQEIENRLTYRLNRAKSAALDVKEFRNYWEAQYIEDARVGIVSVNGLGRPPTSESDLW